MRRAVAARGWRVAGACTRSLVVGLILGTGAAGGALAGEPLAWLARMSEAVDTLNYVGTFVHLSGKESHASRVVHRARGGPMAERVVSLDGQMHEVIRTADETRCILPAYGVVIIDRVGESSLRAALPDYQGGIDDLYQIARLGREQVAGRPAQHIRVSPVDTWRFGYELWLDLETAMPLKTMTVSGRHVVELVHFTEIAFPATIPDDQLAPTQLGDDFVVHRPELPEMVSPQAVPADARSAAASRWAASRLPRGFQLKGAALAAEPTGEGAQHLVYSDGLASVSVFIEHLGARGGRAATASFAELGASNAFSRITGGYRIVVVGEVPADTVTLIGRSMRLLETVGR